MIPVWREAHHEVGGFIEGASKFGVELVPLGMAWATPSGSVTDDFLDNFCDRLVTGIRAAEPDGVLVALHGAMVTPNHPSADTEVLRRLREAIGPAVPLAATLDFHGNVAPAMADHANILVGYQTYPHIDQRERGLLAAELVTRMVRGEVGAVTRIAKPPLILNLLGQDTNRAPMTSLMAKARECEKRPGVLSVSLMAGFPYADVPDMGPAVMAVTDGDAGGAAAIAEELASAIWGYGRSAKNSLFPFPSRARLSREQSPRSERRSYSSILATMSEVDRRAMGRSCWPSYSHKRQRDSSSCSSRPPRPQLLGWSVLAITSRETSVARAIACTASRFPFAAL
jgi:microcystin degradation protein MlrC